MRKYLLQRQEVRIWSLLGAGEVLDNDSIYFSELPCPFE